MLRRVSEHVAERLREAAAVDTRRQGTALPLEGGVPGLRGRSSERRQLDPLRAGRPAAVTVSSFCIYVMHNVDTVARAPALEVLQAGPEPVELRIDHLGMVPGRGIAPKRLARESQRCCGTSQLVLGAGDKLRIPHTASVSL